MLSHVADMLSLIKSICTLLSGAASERVVRGRIGGGETVSERGEERGGGGSSQEVLWYAF